MKNKIQDYFKGNFKQFYEKYLSDIQKVGSKANEFKGLCPFHEDTDPSFNFNNDNSKYFCHGCGKSGNYIHFYAKLKGLRTKEDFIKILKGIANDFGIEWDEDERKIVKTYDYKDEKNKLKFQVCRTEPKGFFQRKPDGKGGYVNNTKGVKKDLYKLPEVLKADEILIVEGEKDCDSLLNIGFTATTCAMGAGKWRDEYNESLKGRNIVLVPDNDPEGKQHMTRVAQSLNGTTKSLKWLELPDLPDKGDVSDFIATFKNKDEAAERLSILIENAEAYEPKKDTPKQSGNVVSTRVKEYLLEEFDGGIFKISDLRRELGLDNAEYTAARQCVKRMQGQGYLQKHGYQLGCYRVIDKKKNVIVWDGVEAGPSGLVLPGGLHNMVTTRKGDMINFAGFKNHNKTAIAIEAIRLNLDNFKIHFFITEYKARMKRRLMDFGIDLQHPNFSAYPIDQGDYIPDKIEPGEGVLNVIDHFPNLDNFYLVGKYQDEIHRALDGAICIITHQKKKPDDLDAIGGSFWTITPTLAVVLFQDGIDCRMEIRKGKEPGDGIFNANGMKLNFKLKRGYQFEYDKAGWK